METTDFITIGDGAVHVEGVGMVSASSICVRDSFAIMTEQQADEAFRRALHQPRILPAEPGKQWCYICGDSKPLEEFPPDTRNTNGRDTRCAACEAERQRRKRARDAEQEGRALRKWVRQAGT